MATTKAQQRATNKYVAKNYDRVNLTLPKGKREKIRAYAEKNGESLNAYLRRLVQEDMGESWD